MFLIACPDCARQYDATGLEPGSQVRCFCERLFLVEWPKKLSAGALSCTHCGGAVSASDEQCPYCQAAISEEDRRQTTLCPGCFTRIDDDSQHCRACGLDIVPQTLSPLPAEHGCPRCAGALRVRSFEIVDVVECSKCLGMWVTPSAFERITLRATRRGTDAAVFVQCADNKATNRPLETVRYIPCLVCSELMLRRQYTYRGRHSGVIIDSCKGHGVWLDRDEIERVVDFISKDGASGAAVKPLDPRPFIVSERAGSRRLREERTEGSWLAEILVEIAGSLFGH